MNVIEDWGNILKASTWPRVDEKGSKRQNIINFCDVVTNYTFLYGIEKE